MAHSRVNSITGIVLAGVHKWDNSGFDELLPRSLMPVAHTPLICHVLGWLREAGIAQTTICASGASRQLRRRLGDGAALGIDLHYYEDWTPRGPAGCIRDSAAHFGAERVIVVDAALLPVGCDLSAALDEHARSGAAMTVVAADDPDGSGEAGGHLVPVGMYVLDRSVLDEIPETGYQDVKEMLLPRLYEKGVCVRSHVLSTPCPRLTDAASYLMLNAWMLEQLVHGREPTLPDYRLVGRSLVHETVHLASPGRLVGTVLIGPHSAIAPDSTIVGPTTIGAECVIESAAVICRSVLWDRCRVGPGASIDHYVLGENVQIEEGARLFHTEWASESSRPCYLPRPPCPRPPVVPTSPEASQQPSSNADESEPTGRSPAGAMEHL